MIIICSFRYRIRLTDRLVPFFVHFRAGIDSLYLMNSVIPSEKSVRGTAAVMLAILTLAFVVSVVQEPTGDWGTVSWLWLVLYVLLFAQLFFTLIKGRPFTVPMSGYGKQYEPSRLNQTKRLARFGVWLLGVAGIVSLVVYGLLGWESTGTMVFGIIAAFFVQSVMQFRWANEAVAAIEGIETGEQA